MENELCNPNIHYKYDIFNKDITDEYKKFAPNVLNILGKEVSNQDKLRQIMTKVEDLSLIAIIGYDWDKKMSENITTLVKRYHPDAFEG